MRLRLAVFLRKLADFLDPTIKPSPEPMTIVLNLDTSNALAALEELRAAWRRSVPRDLTVGE